MPQQTDYIFSGTVNWPRPAGVSIADIIALWPEGGNGGEAFQNADTSYAQGGGGAGGCVARLTAVPITGANLPVDFGSGAYTSLGFGGGYSARVNKGASGGDASESTGGAAGVADISGVTFNAPPATGATHAYLGQDGVAGITPDVASYIGDPPSKPSGGHAANSDGNWDAGSLHDGGVGGDYPPEGGNWDGQQSGLPPGGGAPGGALAGDHTDAPYSGAGGSAALIMIVYTVPVPTPSGRMSGSLASLLILDLI